MRHSFRVARHSPEVSIVFPVRNAAATIAAAIESISAQTFSDWELLVADDGSTDASAAIVQDKAGQDARIRLIRQPASGIVEALRTGCAAARGRFIARMDADDIMRPERIERQWRFLCSDPRVGLVSCRVKFGGDRASQGGYAAHVDWINALITHEQMSLRRFVESPVAHPSVMFRRELLERHGGYASGDFPEDYDLWLRWLEAGVRFGKINDELLTWNDPSHRLSRIDARYRFEAFYRTKSRYLARWLDREVTGRPVWLWGAGRVTRHRFAGLEENGTRVSGFIDIDPAKIGQVRQERPIVHPTEMPGEAFVLVGVGVRGARDLIVAQLNSSGRVEGRDYILAA